MRGNAARAILPAIVVLALVGVVAIAATGSTSAGTGDIRPPAAVLLDTVLSLVLIALLPVAALVIYVLLRRTAPPEYSHSKHIRRVVAGMLSFAALLAFLWYRVPPIPPTDELGPTEIGDPSAVPPLPEDGSYEPSFAWLPVTIVLALVAVGVVAFIVAERRRRGPSRAAETLAEQLALALQDSLDDLRAERDPRRAVIAAYAHLERVLAAGGVARRPAETSDEHLARILGDLEVDQQAIRRLGELFSRAKFSQHTVDLEMKEEAIGTLERVRDELRVATVPVGSGPAPSLRPHGAGT